MPLADALALAHAAATLVLTGLVWTVQLVVYPAFREVGAAAWSQVHAAHVRRITPLVAVPWAVQGTSVAGLLLVAPTPLVVLAAALGAATVAVTGLESAPLHRRLEHGWDADLVERLVRTNWLRTAAWTAAAGCGAVLAVAPPA